MIERCTRPCPCANHHRPKWVVLTGGPGAGKTAALELARRTFCQHVIILPESASVVLKNALLHDNQPAARKAAQRVIYHMQWECEELLKAEPAALVLCDRGLLDGMAYWPDGEKDFLNSLSIHKPDVLNRYDAIIHLRTPTLQQGYNHVNPVRLETASEAAQIDQAIWQVWSDHPKREVIQSQDHFQKKADQVLAFLHSLLPECCKAE